MKVSLKAVVSNARWNKFSLCKLSDVIKAALKAFKELQDEAILKSAVSQLKAIILVQYILQLTNALEKWIGIEKSCLEINETVHRQTILKRSLLSVVSQTKSHDYPRRYVFSRALQGLEQSLIL